MTSSYLIMKFIHVLAVVMWAGGTIMLALLAKMFGRDAAAMRTLGQFGLVSGRFLLMPGSIVTFITGIIMMVQVGGHPPFWMVWGLIASIGSGVIGGVFVRKAGMALADETDPGSERANALRSRLGTLSLINVTLLISAIAVMVLKPE